VVFWCFFDDWLLDIYVAPAKIDRTVGTWKLWGGTSNYHQYIFFGLTKRRGVFCRYWEWPGCGGRSRKKTTRNLTGWWFPPGMLVYVHPMTNRFTGWWFGTFFIFHNIWDNPSHWLIFFTWIETTSHEQWNGSLIGDPILPGPFHVSSWPEMIVFFFRLISPKIIPSLGEFNRLLCFFWRKQHYQRSLLMDVHQLFAVENHTFYQLLYSFGTWSTH